MNTKERTKSDRIMIAKMAVEYLNEQADKKFNYETPGTLTKFKADWSHKYGMAQYKGVIDYLVLRWKDDPKMEAFLKPATIFGRDNFPKYLDEARVLIAHERLKKRLPPFSTYSPVRESNQKLTPFNEYDPTI